MPSRENSQTHTDVLINGPCPGFLVSKESAGGVDEEDFIKAFTDVPPVQVGDVQPRQQTRPD